MAEGRLVEDDLPFCHHGINLALPIGVPARLSTGDLTLTVLEPAVTG